jgi:ATP synthase protein I
MLTGIGLFFETIIALMMLIGSGASTIGNLLFAWGVFSQNTTQDPNILLTKFYIAEFTKIVVVVGIFAMTFLLIEEAEPVSLASAYFVTQFFPTALAALQDDGNS